jgi:hypothetical protein
MNSYSIIKIKAIEIQTNVFLGNSYSIINIKNSIGGNIK